MIAAGKNNRLKMEYPMKLWPFRAATRAGQNAIAIQMTANKIHQRADMAASSPRSHGKPGRSWTKSSLSLSVSGSNGGSSGAWAAQAADLAPAHHYLRTALELAQPHGYQATILEQGPGITALLRSLPASPGIRAYIDELSVRAEAATATPNGPAGLPPGGPLSDRELTVLRLLSSRLTTTEIAGALFVSPNTGRDRACSGSASGTR